MRKESDRKTIRRATALAAVLGWSLAATPALAEWSPWTFRLRGLATNHEKSYSEGFSLGSAHLEVEEARGLELGAEVRMADWFGLDLALGTLRSDATGRFVERRVVSFEPLVFEEVETFREEGHFDVDLFTVTWLFHPVRRGRFDFQVGPLLSLARYDTDVGDDRDEELGWGGRLGVEVGLGDAGPWSLGFELRHLELLHEELDHDYYGDLGLDIAALSIGWRTGGAR